MNISHKLGTVGHLHVLLQSMIWLGVQKLFQNVIPSNCRPPLSNTSPPKKNISKNFFLELDDIIVVSLMTMMVCMSYRSKRSQVYRCSIKPACNFIDIWLTHKDLIYNGPL